MRVRHLQNHLAEQDLIYTAKLDSLQGVRIGVDAVYWLRSIQALKDPFADALGGIPPGIFGFVDKEVENFRKHNIRPVFVFQGVAAGPQHAMFVARLDYQMEQAWSCLEKGAKAEAQKCFAVSTSRINGDFVYFIFHHLRNKGYECIQAPYFAGAQLAHLAERNVVSTVFGVPGFLLYGMSSVITQLNFAHGNFEWVSLDAVLQKWNIKRDQFIDACMLAGTEYCLTFPFLSQQYTASPNKFNFEMAVTVIKQHPLINWMSHFQQEDVKADHLQGYCICKVLVQNSPVFHLQDSVIRPLGQDTKLPNDFSTIMGDKLPNSLYYLMLVGMISHKIPQALAKSEWTDKSQPLVDTKEFRDLLVDLSDYRQASLGLIARHLSKGFQTKKVLCKRFWDGPNIRQALPGQDYSKLPGAKTLQPDMTKGLRWNITKEMVEAEMARQGVTQVDFKFCLAWHSYAVDNKGSLVKGLHKKNEFATAESDVKALTALVHFMVIEKLELIDDEGSETVFGSALKDFPQDIQEPCLVAIELMKLGLLSSEPYSTPTDRPFPADVKYPRSDCDDAVKAKLLLCRVMSLVPMRLKVEMWNADVDFDLAAFHGLVRTLKRTLRQLVEASLGSVLLQNLNRVKCFPPGFMCASPDPKNGWKSPAVLPTFMIPRACMGIITKFFLNYEGKRFEQDLQAKFSCCHKPMEDLEVGFKFFKALHQVVEQFQEKGLDGFEEFGQEMQRANLLLESQKRKLGLP